MAINKEKKELAVAALRNGTVIDHIPSTALFQAVKILGIAELDTNVTIGFNLDSRKLGKKGIIKVADVEFPEGILDRIALIAPTAVVNTIRDYEVVEKHPVKLPDTVTGIVKCGNPKCITNNEPMSTVFHVAHGSGPKPAVLRCHYCNHAVEASKAQML